MNAPAYRKDAVHLYREVGAAITPTTDEARRLAAGKLSLPHAVLDKGDLGSMTEIVRDLADAATTDRQRELVAELSGFLEYLRLQLDA